MSHRDRDGLTPGTYEANADDNNYFYFVRSHNNVTRAHFHKSVEMVFVLSGRETVCINGKRQTLCPGQIAFSDCYASHYYTCEQEGDIIVMLLSSAYLGDFDRAMGKKTLPPFMTSVTANAPVFELLEQWAVAPKGDLLIRQGYIDLMLGLLARAYEPVEKRGAEGNLASDLMRFLEENYESDITLDALAARFGYSRNYCSKLFNLYTGTRLTEYLGRLRAEKARERLGRPENADKSVLQIATDCGFNSLNTFYRAYKAAFGQLPRRDKKS